MTAQDLAVWLQAIRGVAYASKDLKMDESIVQDIAISWLRSRYMREAVSDMLISEKEVVTKTSRWYGQARADGMIAFFDAHHRVQVVSLEAKSLKTIMDITQGFDDARWILHSIALALFTSLLVIVGAVNFLDGFLAWSAPIVTFVLVGVLFLALTANSKFYRFPYALQQLQAYPANYRWLAIGSDAAESLGDQELEPLMAGAKYARIGLLMVEPTNAVRVLLEPRRRRKPIGRRDYLDAYARGDDLRSRLAKGNLRHDDI